MSTSLRAGQTHSMPLGWNPPPTIDEVRLEDGRTVETPRHFEGRVLLKASLELHLASHSALDGREGGFWIGCDAPFYFSTIQARDEDFRAPDLMIFLGVERRERKAWLVWDESGKRPDVIIELLSSTTADLDRTTKKRLYGPLLAIPNYILFDPFSGELEVLEWRTQGWSVVPANAAGRYHVNALGLDVGLWRGTVGGIEADWLRWFTPRGDLVQSPDERAEAESRRAEAEFERAEALARRLTEYEARFGALEPKDG